MSDKDLIDVVDDNDNVIDTRPKKEIRENVLTHRGVNLILLNSKNEIFVHQRSLNKKSFAGYWAIFFGGYVDHGENYETAALRELKEESGIETNKLDFLSEFRYKVKNDDWFGKLFKLQSDDKVILQKEEIEQGFFIPLNKLDEFVNSNNIKPSDKFIFENFKDLIK